MDFEKVIKKKKSLKSPHTSKTVGWKLMHSCENGNFDKYVMFFAYVKVEYVTFAYEFFFICKSHFHISCVKHKRPTRAGLFIRFLPLGARCKHDRWVLACLKDE